jgi:hypothetical protein
MRKLLFALLFVAGLRCFAQANPQNTYGRCHDNDVFAAANRNDPANAQALRFALQIQRSCNLTVVEQYVLHHPQFTDAQKEEIAQNLLKFVEQARQDKQVGATDNSTGTTSLVSKGVGAIVGVALESGSIDRTTSGNATTLTINAAQGVNFLTAGNIKPCALIETDCSAGRTLLTALTVSTTYNVSQANTSTNSSAAQEALSALVGSNNPAFSGVAARLDFHARKKKVKIDDLVATYQGSDYITAAEAFATTFDSLVSPIHSDSDYQTAVNEAFSQLRDSAATPGDAEADSVLSQLVSKIADVVNKHTAAFQAYASAENAYHGKRDTALAAVLNKWTTSFEYDYNRVASQPDQSSFKWIYSYRSDTNDNSKIMQITANAGATIYDSLVGSSTSRVRSAQAAFQLDYTATSSASKVQTALSGGYYFQYMAANGLLTLPATQLAPGTAIPLPGNASELLNTKGPIHIGQGKVTLSVKGTNVSIPLALTFSNRTDLIKATKVGGNFGITYDFSSIFSALKR